VDNGRSTSRDILQIKTQEKNSKILGVTGNVIRLLENANENRKIRNIIRNSTGACSIVTTANMRNSHAVRRNLVCASGYEKFRAEE